MGGAGPERAQHLGTAWVPRRDPAPSQTVSQQEPTEASCSRGHAHETSHRLSSQHLSRTSGNTCLVCSL